MNRLVERFISYAKVHTESVYHAPPGTPTSQRQFDLANMLADEMRAMGLEGVRVDDTCYAYGFLPATPGCEDLPAIGLIAHMDTTPDFTGKDVKPQIIRYEGGELVLNAEQNIVMTPEQFPDLLKFVGKELICTDGTTLLGADDKSGVAVIMQAVEEIIAEGKPHGRICLGFTPDEEVGRGASNFDVEGFGADFAFTFDGGAPNEYEYETFNAAWAEVNIHGLSVHPGMSKDRMKNALLIAGEYNALLPALETPAHTEGYQGFYHLQEMHGTVDNTKMIYIVRDHSMERFLERKSVMEAAAAQINARYGEGTVELDMRDQYYNMYEILKDHMEIIDLAVGAMQASGIAEPTHPPIRGGTDGCMLTYKGLLCPNLPASGYNAHGRYEFLPIEELETCVVIVKNMLTPELIRRYYKKEA